MKTTVDLQAIIHQYLLEKNPEASEYQIAVAEYVLIQNVFEHIVCTDLRAGEPQPSDGQQRFLVMMNYRAVREMYKYYVDLNKNFIQDAQRFNNGHTSRTMVREILVKLKAFKLVGIDYWNMDHSEPEVREGYSLETYKAIGAMKL